MLGWFKRRLPANQGPDYSHIDSREKAEDLYRRGELKKLLLVPAEFGGQDILPNVVYVPAIAVDLKARMDLNTIKPLVQNGQARRYSATPEYEGRSFIPSLLRILATDPGRFEGTIAIWGKAVQNEAKPVSEKNAGDQSAFTPASTPVEALGPEDLVRAFIADFENWNRFAYHRTSTLGPRDGIAAAESAYDALLRKFCPPGLQHQPIAFGTYSRHDTALEAILGSELAIDSCVVKTRHTKTEGKTIIAQDCEYHLKKIGERWFLTSILHVVGDRKLEGL